MIQQRTREAVPPFVISPKSTDWVEVKCEQNLPSHWVISSSEMDLSRKRLVLALLCITCE